MSNFECVKFSLSVQSFYKRNFIELYHLTPAYFIWKLLRNRRHPISIFLPPKWSFFWIPEFAQGAYFWSHLRLQYQLLSAVPKSVWTWKYKPTSKIISPSKIYSWVSFSSCLIRNEVSLFRTLIVNKSVWSASGSRNAKLYLTYTIKSILIQFSAESLKLASLTKYQISIKFNRIRGLTEWTTHFRKKKMLATSNFIDSFVHSFRAFNSYPWIFGTVTITGNVTVGTWKIKIICADRLPLGLSYDANFKWHMPIRGEICRVEQKSMPFFSEKKNPKHRNIYKWHNTALRIFPQNTLGDGPPFRFFFPGFAEKG